MRFAKEIVLPALLVAGCAPTMQVGYTPSGMAGNAVFFVESRADRDRQYLVLCHPQRTPPCARVAPGTIHDRQELAAWVQSQEEARRASRPEPRPRPRREVAPPAAEVPIVPDEEWADSSVVVNEPRPPGEGPPPTPAPGVGTVNVITPGGWANVYDAEGHFLGQTPIQLQLREGVQQLSLRPFGQPPGDREPIRVSVRSQETVSIVRRLEETPDVVGAAP